MRTIGMIGGMSWESSAIYYWMVNAAVKARLGGHHSAETVTYSVDFAPIKRLQHEGRWEETAASLARAAEAVSNPLLHIADATAEEIKARASRRWVSWSTRFTMVQDFYKGRFAGSTA